MGDRLHLRQAACRIDGHIVHADRLSGLHDQAIGDLFEYPEQHHGAGGGPGQLHHAFAERILDPLTVLFHFKNVTIAKTVAATPVDHYHIITSNAVQAIEEANDAGFHFSIWCGGIEG